MLLAGSMFKVMIPLQI